MKSARSATPVKKPARRKSASAALGNLRIQPYAEQTPKGAATRAKLIAIAERLFAERGIEGVTLLDINKAAGQRNRNASHYHFGSKQGLIQAILDKHLPGIALRRSQMLDEIDAHGTAQLRDVVRALVYPVAEKLFDPNGGREYIRVNAKLVAQHAMGMHKLDNAPFQIGQQDRLIRAFQQVTPHLPELLAFQRGLMSSVLLFNGLADHTRILQAVDVSVQALHTELFIHNLEDALVALLGAPLSAETEDLYRRLNEASDIPKPVQT